jgi:hypothetical protein
MGKRKKVKGKRIPILKGLIEFGTSFSWGKESILFTFNYPRGWDKRLRE